MNANALVIFGLAAVLLLAGCAGKSQGKPNETSTGQAPAVAPPASLPPVERESAIPASAVKMTPQADMYPPLLNSSDYEQPVPLPSPISTAGAEDSPFITPDGNDFYFFFTPDVSKTPQQQLFDGVTGIWHSGNTGGAWSKPERVVLQDAGKLALDGCEFAQGSTMWFCSAREGYAGVNLFTAEFTNGKWGGWKPVDEALRQYETGEMHITADGSEMYFHSPRAGGKGQLDIWVTRKENGGWQQPVSVEAVNTPENEGWPFVSQDGSELWFTRFYQGSPAIFRSKKAGGEWQAPELIVSQFAGEPTLDNTGNLYFTHHFYANGTMIEADIYLARKKP